MPRFFAIVWIIIIALLHAILSDLPTYSPLDFLQLDKLVHALFFIAYVLITKLYTLQYYLTTLYYHITNYLWADIETLSRVFLSAFHGYIRLAG